MTRIELLERLCIVRLKAAGMVGGVPLALELGHIILKIQDGGVQDGKPPRDVNRDARLRSSFGNVVTDRFS